MTSPAILIVEDDACMREALFDTLSSDEQPVLLADDGTEALKILNRENIGLVVTDLQMQPMDGATLLGEMQLRHPAVPAVMMTAHGSIENAVESLHKGAADYLVKPFEADQLRYVVDRYLVADTGENGPVAADAQSVELLRIARRVAASEATVTISGESGCGKEVIAQYIHDQSNRKDRPFVAINCAAIPETMLEAVLFGHEKGAYTGATQSHPGKFEQANGGTLLLDEISEMDLALQAKLLRVIQEKEVERIGGRKLIPLDVRVLATTNRDLKQAVAEGRFREDLYYRLNVFPLHIAPLRERRDDILPLAKMAICRHASATQGRVRLSATAREALLSYDWPGNVRELENLIQRSLIMLRGDILQAADLAFDTESETGADTAADTAAVTDTAAVSAPQGLNAGLRNHEFDMIVEAMRHYAGKRSAVAKALGISTRTLRYKLARMREEGIGPAGEAL